MWVVCEKSNLFINLDRIDSISFPYFERDTWNCDLDGEENAAYRIAVKLTAEERADLVKALVFALKMGSAVFSVDEWRRGKYRVPDRAL